MYKNSFYIYYKDNDISHHGIKGQKWGVRRYQNLDGSLTEEGKKRYNKGKENEKYGILVSLATFAIEAAVQSSKSKKANNRKKAVDEEIKNNPNIDKKTGLKLKSREYTEIEDMRMVNPSYDETKWETTNNCGLCSVTYELRRKGYDVTAATSTDGSTTKELAAAFGQKDSEKIATDRGGSRLTPERARATYNELSKRENQTGLLLVRWYSGYGGHAVNYEIKNGQLIIRDCQSMKIYTKQKHIERIFRASKEVSIIRADNAKVNFKIAKGCVDTYDEKGV